MVEISVLSNRELKAHDLLIQLLGAMSKLSFESRHVVYDRWRMLNLLTTDDLTRFEINIQRILKPVPNPTKVVVSEGGSTLA